MTAKTPDHVPARAPRWKTATVLAGIALIPLIYAGALTAASQDPTHHLDAVPAAVVNADHRASTADGEAIDLGSTLTEELTGDRGGSNLAWTPMDADRAAEELTSGGVYAVLTIPEDFSASAASTGGKDPDAARRAQLTIQTNDGVNMIAGNIAASVGQQIERSLNSGISETYLKNVYVGFTTLHDELAEASDGAGKLADGTSEARSGSEELVVGLGDLSSGNARLSEGATALASGAHSAHDGARRLDKGLSTLAEKTARLPEQTDALDAGVRDLASGAGALAGGAADAAAGSRALSDSASTLAAGAETAASGAQSLSEGADNLAGGASSAAAGAGKLEAGVARLDAGAIDALDGGQALASGAGQLADATASLSTGAADVDAGLRELVENYAALTDEQRLGVLSQLQDGAAGVSEGAATSTRAASGLSAGAQDLVGDAGKGTGLAALSSGAHRLAGGAHELVGDADAGTGLAAVSAGADRLASGTRELVGDAGKGTGLAALSAGADRLAAGAGDLNGGIGKLSSGAERLDSGSGALAAGVSSLSGGLEPLSSSLAEAADGSSALADGTADLAAGAGSLASGASDAASGASSAASGARSLKDGLGSLREGSGELATGLADGAERTPSYTDAESERLSAVTAMPADLDAERLNAVPQYGYGLAPYFMSLALWVGALGFYLMNDPLRPSLVASRKPSWHTAFRSYVPGALMGVVQGVLMVLVIRLGLGVEAANTAGLFGIAVLTSMVFIAMNQALIALLKAPGRFLALLFVVFQLAAAGGTYPIETSPALFQAIHEILPLTHSVEAFRSLIAGGSAGVAPAVGILSAWLAGALAVTVLAVRRQRRGPAPLVTGVLPA